MNIPLEKKESGTYAYSLRMWGILHQILKEWEWIYIGEFFLQSIKFL
jgi:hypothetical protein